ncbi:MAG: dihydrofolate reductase family protein [Dehalococcoidia bacterium]
MHTDADLPLPVKTYLALRFPPPSSNRPYVILNMISSADGKAVVGSSEAALGSPTDKLVLQALRVHADAILNGSGTAQATGLSPLIRDPRLRQAREQRGKTGPPLQAIISRSGRLPLDAPFLRSRDFRSVLFVGASADPEQVAQLRRTDRSIEVLRPEEGPEAVLRRLRLDYGIKLLLLEGGPTLNESFFRLGLIDEFFMTLAPHVVAGRDTLTVVEGQAFDKRTMPALSLITALSHCETNEVYLHWRVALKTTG